MLIGTTYAWFTDSVSSANNIIKTGNLDVELEYAKTKDGKLSDWKSVAGSSDIFGPNILWEPGKVEVVYFKASNIGNLALKYELFVKILSETVGYNEEGDEIYLSDLLVSKVVNMNDTLTVFTDRKAVINAAGSTMGIKDYVSPVGVLAPGESEYLAMILYMPDSVGNESNYCGVDIPTIELGVNLMATQASYENDSFGNDYDEDAYLPNTYGLVVKSNSDVQLGDYDFALWDQKRVDALVHITDGSEANIYGNTNRLVHCGSVPAAPAISVNDNSVVNIYGGSYSSVDAPIINAIEGSKVNIYRGIFRADSFTGDGAHTDLLINCDTASGSEIKIYGGTFVNFDPSASGLGSLIDESCVILTTERENGEIWYTVVPEEYKDYTPIFNVDDAMNALNNGISELLFACDIEPTPDTETLLFATNTNTMKFSGHGSIITISGTGTSSAHQDYGYVGFIPIAGYDAEISDMTFVGEGFVEVGHHHGTHIDGGGNYTIENITIDHLISTLHIPNGDAFIAPAFCHYGKATMKDCVMIGTTTKKVGYTPYDAAFVNKTTTFIEGGRYGSIYMSHQSHVTLTDVEVDNIDCYAIKNSNLGKLTVSAGAKVQTINLLQGGYRPSIVVEAGAEIGQIIYDGSRQSDIVIKDGAIVGEIIHNGVSYTLEEWLAKK
jgi:predicted ribosomally synthesized peptide with SipW-like signal peptide